MGGPKPKKKPAILPFPLPDTLAACTDWLRRIQAGGVNPRPRIRIERERAAMGSGVIDFSAFDDLDAFKARIGALKEDR